MSLSTILIILALLIAFYIFSVYNKFKTIETRLKASIQEIGNQLKRQADLIPNLVSSAKGYLKHEKGIFEKLTEARKTITKAVESGDVRKMSEAGSKLAALLPDLK